MQAVDMLSHASLHADKRVREHLRMGDVLQLRDKSYSPLGLRNDQQQLDVAWPKEYWAEG